MKSTGKYIYMYVYIYIYKYICIYIHKSLYVYIYIYTYMYIYNYTYIYIYEFIYIYIYIYICIYRNLRANSAYERQCITFLPGSPFMSDLLRCCELSNASSTEVQAMRVQLFSRSRVSLFDFNHEEE
jgi:hypothetical protein